jgi:hypothetical protein
MFSCLVNLSHVNSFLENNFVQVNSCHSSFVLVLVASVSNESLKKRLKYVDQS